MEILFPLLIVAIIAIALFVIIHSASKREEARELLPDAEKEYHSALEALKRQPSNSDLRQHALILGRKYSALTRESAGSGSAVTVYDEVAVMNDISAASGNFSEGNRTIESRLTELTQLKVKNLIDDGEYSRRRNEILDEI